VLIIVGLGALAGITYPSRETIDIGPLHATADTQKTLPPVLGIAAVVGGLVLLMAGVRKRA
jgi:hypothetical protein